MKQNNFYLCCTSCSGSIFSEQQFATGEW